MTDVDVAATLLYPIGGITNDGLKLGLIDSQAKAAQNDKWTVTNASTVLMAFVQDDTAGVADVCTYSTNTITLTGSTTGASTGLIVYK